VILEEVGMTHDPDLLRLAARISDAGAKLIIEARSLDLEVRHLGQTEL
jgi:hypothetical protein